MQIYFIHTPGATLLAQAATRAVLGVYVYWSLLTMHPPRSHTRPGLCSNVCVRADTLPFAQFRFQVGIGVSEYGGHGGIFTPHNKRAPNQPQDTRAGQHPHPHVPAWHTTAVATGESSCMAGLAGRA
jgi:hypothetical protein